MDMDNHSIDPIGENQVDQVQSAVKDVLVDKYEKLNKELQNICITIGKLNEEYSIKSAELTNQKESIEEAISHIKAILKYDGYKVDVGNKNGVNPFVQAQGESINDASFKLLEELHRPLNYKEIAGKLTKNNIYIPGKNPAATLLSRLSRDKRFKRTKQRGVYALSTWRIKTPSKKSKRKPK